MNKTSTLSHRRVRSNAARPRTTLHISTEPGLSPKPETLSFLRQFARAFYPGTGSRTLDIVLN